ncbi:hypothetical protein CYMTET_37115 [Cymbomonas tetramitiformis]|uniref:Uncharacterized protein n=1 Tax=Cymbomonas tetramitiformis TaxID=36881 RepID=A0AAE0CGC9_9CHLO|nr:hypothetical protein CYMTET_37115 [Cymbomonas tetramitiformis]
MISSNITTCGVICPVSLVKRTTRPSRSSTGRKAIRNNSGNNQRFSLRQNLATTCPVTTFHSPSRRLKTPTSCSTEFGEGSSARPFGEVCAQVSRSFYEACLPQLGVPYEQALHAFSSGCKEAYVTGAAVASISLQLQMSTATGNDELDAFIAQRGGLQAEEIELRTSWISICYLTFDEANVLRDDIPASGQAGLEEERLGIFVRNVVHLAKQGYDAQRVKLAEVLKMSSADAQPRSDMESAVMSQAVRLVFCSLDACGGRLVPPSEVLDAQPPPNNSTEGVADALPPSDTPDKPASNRGAKFAARKKMEEERKRGEE